MASAGLSPLEVLRQTDLRISSTRDDAALLAPGEMNLHPDKEAEPPLCPDRAAPVIQPVEAHGGLYRLVEPYSPSLPEPLESAIGLRIDVTGDDKPFFNGASVPVWAWWFLRPMEPRVVSAALVHDLLYAQSGRVAEDVQLSRNFADMCFFWASDKSSLEFYRSWVAYVTLATFGGRTFRQLAHGGAPRPTTRAEWEQQLAKAVLDVCIRNVGGLAGVFAVALLMVLVGIPGAILGVAHGEYAASALVLPAGVGALLVGAQIRQLAWLSWTSRGHATSVRNRRSAKPLP